MYLPRIASCSSKTLCALVISELGVYSVPYTPSPITPLLAVMSWSKYCSTKTWLTYFDWNRESLAGAVNFEITMICLWLNKKIRINLFLHALWFHKTRPKKDISHAEINQNTETSLKFTATFKSGGGCIQVGITSIINNTCLHMWFQNKRKFYFQSVITIRQLHHIADVQSIESLWTIRHYMCHVMKPTNYYASLARKSLNNRSFNTILNWDLPQYFGVVHTSSSGGLQWMELRQYSSRLTFGGTNEE